MRLPLSGVVVAGFFYDVSLPPPRQFSRAADAEIFLRPSARLLDGNILGGSPFFT